MEKRPALAFVETLARDLIEDSDADLGGFAHLLQKDSHCQILPVEEWYGEAADQLGVLHKRGLLVMVVMEGGYDDKITKRNRETMAKSRDFLGSDVPYLILPRHHFQEPDFIVAEPNIIIAQKYSKRLHAFINTLVDTCPGALNERRRLVYPEMQALVQSYNANYPEETLQYSPDDNTKIVAEYLRYRALGGEVTAKDFDAKVSMPTTFEVQQDGLYEQELERVRQMGKAHREALMEAIFTRQGMEKTPWGTWFQASGSRGRFCHSFAIEPSSFMSVLFQGFGGHRGGAVKLLKRKMAAFESIRKGEVNHDFIAAEDMELEVVSGYANERVLNFQTPLLQIFSQDVTLATLRRVGKHIVSEKKLIPIDNYGEVIDQNYRKNDCNANTD